MVGRYDDERRKLRRAVVALLVVGAAIFVALVVLGVEVARVAGPLERFVTVIGGGRR